MATKPRGLSDPPHIEFERAVYGSSLTAPAALGSKMKYAEPYASISATELLSEDISHSGWIRKEGLSIRTWKDRYMILHHGCIYYFKGTYSTVPKGKFALNGYRCEVAPERDKADKYSYNFKLVSENENERTYFFSCPSKSEMEGWIKEINDDIRTYCSEQDDEFYDYVDASNFCEKKYPTVSKDLPPRPERRRNYSSLPSSPEESRHLFPHRESDYHGISHRFPNQPQSSPTPIPRKPIIPPKIPVRPTHANPSTTDQEDSDSDYIPGEPEDPYLDLTAPENEPINSPDSTRGSGSPGSAFPLPPQRPQRGLPSVEKGAQNETATNPETEEIYLPVIADDDEQTQCEPPDGSPTNSVRKVPIPPHRVPPKYPPSTPDDPCLRNGTGEEIYLPVITDDEDTKCEQNNKPHPSEKTKMVPPRAPKRHPKPKPVPSKPCIDDEDSYYLPQNCMKPDLQKEQAKILLELGREVGIYLITKSQTSNTKLVLSAWMSDGLKRYLIFKDKEMFTLDPETHERFPSLCQLVKYYYTNPLPRSSHFLTAPFK